MAENTSTRSSRSTQDSALGDSSDAATSTPAPSPLVTDQGNTIVEETVVQKLAGLAAREVPGVHAMGNAARRTFDAISERIPGSRTQAGGGVSVEKGDRQTALDLNVIVEYGAAIVDVAENIRHNVIHAVEHGTGLEVVEVNITVADVHLPEDEDDDARDSDLDLA